MFSVVIPLYNKSHTIRRTLSSVLAQTFLEFEVLVIDDGSTDDGATIVREFDDRRIRLVTQANSGRASARNRGIKEAVHPYIAFLDADDAWLHNHLQTIAALISLFPGYALYATGYRVSKDGASTSLQEVLGGSLLSKTTRDPRALETELDYFTAKARGRSATFFTSTVAVPRETFESVGLFEPRHPLAQDTHLWVRICAHHPIVVSPQPTAIYFIDTPGNTATTRGARLEFPECQLHPAADYLHDEGLAGKIPSEKRLVVAAFVAKHLEQRLWVLLAEGRQSDARELYPFFRHFSRKERLLYRTLTELEPRLFQLLRKVRKFFKAR